MGFGLACAPVRCAHPSFWLINTPNRALCAPPAYHSFAALLLTKKKTRKFQFGKKIRQSIPLLIKFNRATPGGTVNLHV